MSWQALTFPAFVSREGVDGSNLALTEAPIAERGRHVADFLTARLVDGTDPISDVLRFSKANCGDNVNYSNPHTILHRPEP